MEQELTRATVDPRYTWDVKRVYESDEAWEQAFAGVKEQAAAFSALAGTLGRGREAILGALRARVVTDLVLDDGAARELLDLVRTRSGQTRGGLR